LSKSISSRKLGFSLIFVLFVFILILAQLAGHFLQQEVPDVEIVPVHPGVKLILYLLENKHFAWCPGKAANRHTVEHIVLEESVCCDELPSHVLLHLLDDLVVPVQAHVREAGSEYDISALLHRKEHLFKKRVLHVIVVNEACANAKIKLIFELLRECVGTVGNIAKGMLVQLTVHTFDGSLLEHVRANVHAHDIFETLRSEIFTDKSSSASHINNLAVSWFLFVLFGEFANVFSDELGIWVTHLQVHALVVGGDVVKVDLGLLLVELVAAVVHLDMLLVKWHFFIPLKFFNWISVPVSATHGGCCSSVKKSAASFGDAFL